MIEAMCYVLRTGIPWRACPGTLVLGNRSIRVGDVGAAQAMGRTKGGLNTKLAMIVDALGRPIAIRLAPGNRHDLKACEGLWRELRNGWLVADRAFDSDALRAALAAHGIFACIPLKARRRKTYQFSKKL